MAICRLRSFIEQEERGLDVNMVHMVVELYIFQGEFGECEEFMDQHIALD